MQSTSKLAHRKRQEHAINTMTVSEVALDMLILDTTIFRYDFEHKVMAADAMCKLKLVLGKSHDP